MSTSAPPAGGPRFPGNGLHPLARALNASVRFDRRLWREDIQGSLAHAAELRAQGLLTAADHDAICAGLAAIADDIAAGRFDWDEALEDVHMNIEARLTERVGEAGRRLHTGRSRNDQVATDLRLWVMAAADRCRAALAGLRTALVERAAETVEVLLPGYTHLQRAQPVRLALHLMAYYEMFTRDDARLADARGRAAVMPLGSAALAGTGFPYDRARVAAALGFTRPSANALDAVSDRDFAVEAIAAAALGMTHLSRLGEELVLWSTAEFGFVELDPAWTTGSSIMPQKRNPDVCELLRGKAGRVTGDLVALLTVLKGLPLAYNKDLQEDKEPVFDALDTLHDCAAAAEGIVRTARFQETRLRAALDDGGGYPTATELADYLVERGVPFRDAYASAAEVVRRCRDTGRRLDELSAAELAAADARFGPDVAARLTPEAAVERRRALGGTSRAQVQAQILAAREALAAFPIDQKHRQKESK
ncbi:MAG TPA: argininosuccinate lyase [Myxococcota bacterium]|nr:argininosuccinate lyase [Myxococcota bacterium]